MFVSLVFALVSETTKKERKNKQTIKKQRKTTGKKRKQINNSVHYLSMTCWPSWRKKTLHSDPCGDDLVYILSACDFCFVFVVVVVVFCFVLFCFALSSCFFFVLFCFFFFGLASHVRMYEPVNYNRLTGLSPDTCATKGCS